MIPCIVYRYMSKLGKQYILNSGDMNSLEIYDTYHDIDITCNLGPNMLLKQCMMLVCDFSKCTRHYASSMWGAASAIRIFFMDWSHLNSIYPRAQKIYRIDPRIPEILFKVSLGFFNMGILILNHHRSTTLGRMGLNRWQMKPKYHVTCLHDISSTWNIQWS